MTTNQNGNYEFTKNELFSFVNSVMQAKAQMDFNSGALKENFTPWYQILEFMKSKNIVFSNEEPEYSTNVEIKS